MNTLLCTDVYKIGHAAQYPADTEYVYSYLEARKPGKTVFFGLQYLLLKYLIKPVTSDNVFDFIRIFELILGKAKDTDIRRFLDLADLGYWPISIKAVPEGSIVENGNVLLTIRNTHPKFAWCVGFLESFLLKLWNPCTVATCSLEYKALVTQFAKETCDNLDHIPFAVHDFGYRGVSSEETAAISGAAHLINFLGSDTVPAVDLLHRYYKTRSKETPIGLSVPASEHSVMCAYTKEKEFEAFDRMLELYPTGIVSIVSDTYDLWNVLTNYTQSRKEKILARDGKVVFRPDSGDPVKIVCGDPLAFENSPAKKGALELLWDVFGGTYNDKGYRVLNSKVGLIYGDGMYRERFVDMLSTMKQNGWASSNLVIGVGGLLLQQHSRDEFGFAIKATHVVRDGKPVEIFKDPITDPGKKSKKGYMKLMRYANGVYYTMDQQPNDDGGLLTPVFHDGHVQFQFLEDVRKTLDESVKGWGS